MKTPSIALFRHLNALIRHSIWKWYFESNGKLEQRTVVLHERKKRPIFESFPLHLQKCVIEYAVVFFWQDTASKTTQMK